MTGIVIESTKRFGVHSPPGGNIKQNAAVLPNIEKIQNTKNIKAVATTSTAVAASIDLEALILSTLASGSDIPDSWIFAENHKQDHQLLVGAIKSLLVDAYVADQPITSSFWVLTDEGSEIAAKGSPEFQVYQAIPSEGINVNDLNASLGNTAKIGLGPCMKNKWLKKDGDIILRIMDEVKDETATSLSAIANPKASSEVSEEDLKNLKRRKLVNQIVRKSYKIVKGAEFQPHRVRKAADLTKEMLGVASDVSQSDYLSMSCCSFHVNVLSRSWLAVWLLHGPCNL